MKFRETIVLLLGIIVLLVAAETDDETILGSSSSDDDLVADEEMEDEPEWRELVGDHTEEAEFDAETPEEEGDSVPSFEEHPGNWIADYGNEAARSMSRGVNVDDAVIVVHDHERHHYTVTRRPLEQEELEDAEKDEDTSDGNRFNGLYKVTKGDLESGKVEELGMPGELRISNQLIEQKKITEGSILILRDGIFRVTAVKPTEMAYCEVECQLSDMAHAFKNAEWSHHADNIGASEITDTDGKRISTLPPTKAHLAQLRDAAEDVQREEAETRMDQITDDAIHKLQDQIPHELVEGNAEEKAAYKKMRAKLFTKFGRGIEAARKLAIETRGGDVQAGEIEDQDNWRCCRRFRRFVRRAVRRVRRVYRRVRRRVRRVVRRVRRRVSRAYRRARRWVRKKAKKARRWVRKTYKKAKKGFNRAKKWVKKKYNQAKKAVKKGVNWVKKKAKKAWSAVKKVAKKTWDKAKKFAKKVAKGVKKLADKAKKTWDKVKSRVKKAWTKFKDTMKKVGSAIKKFAKMAVKALGKVLTKLKDALLRYLKMFVGIIDWNLSKTLVSFRFDKSGLKLLKYSKQSKGVNMTAEATLQKATVAFSAGFVFKGKIKFYIPRYIIAKIWFKSEFALKVMAKASMTYNKNKDQELFKLIKPISFSIGPIPVYIEIEFKIIAGVIVKFNGNLNFSYGYSVRNRIEVGAEYKFPTKFKPIWVKEKKEVRDGPNLEICANAYAEAFLRPQIGAFLYKTAGPVFILEPYVNFEFLGQGSQYCDGSRVKKGIKDTDVETEVQNADEMDSEEEDSDSSDDEDEEAFEDAKKAISSAVLASKQLGHEEQLQDEEHDQWFRRIRRAVRRVRRRVRRRRRPRRRRYRRPRRRRFRLFRRVRRRIRRVVRRRKPRRRRFNIRRIVRRVKRRMPRRRRIVRRRKPRRRRSFIRRIVRRVRRRLPRRRRVRRRRRIRRRPRRRRRSRRRRPRRRRRSRRRRRPRRRRRSRRRRRPRRRRRSRRRPRRRRRSRRRRSRRRPRRRRKQSDGGYGAKSRAEKAKIRRAKSNMSRDKRKMANAKRQYAAKMRKAKSEEKREMAKLAAAKRKRAAEKRAVETHHKKALAARKGRKYKIDRANKNLGAGGHGGVSKTHPSYWVVRLGVRSRVEFKISIAGKIKVSEWRKTFFDKSIILANGCLQLGFKCHAGNDSGSLKPSQKDFGSLRGAITKAVGNDPRVAKLYNYVKKGGEYGKKAREIIDKGRGYLKKGREYIDKAKNYKKTIMGKVDKYKNKFKGYVDKAKKWKKKVTSHVKGIRKKAEGMYKKYKGKVTKYKDKFEKYKKKYKGHVDKWKSKAEKWKKKAVDFVERVKIGKKCIKYASGRGAKQCKKVKTCLQYGGGNRVGQCLEWKDHCTESPGTDRHCVKTKRSYHCQKYKTTRECAHYTTKKTPGPCTEKKVCANYAGGGLRRCVKQCERVCRDEEKWIVIWTEPHIQTLDGHDYLWNDIGPYWLIKPYPSGFGVQVWSSPAHKDGQMLHAAVFMGAAVKVGSDVVELYANPNIVLVNGVRVGNNEGLDGGKVSSKLDAAGYLVKSGSNEYAVVSPSDHTALMVKYVATNGGKEWILDVNARISPIVKSKGWYTFGLLGDWDGVRGDSNILKRVSEVKVDDGAQYFSRQLSMSDKYEPWSMDDLKTKLSGYKAKFQHAETVCKKQGLGEGYRLEACIYDVLITGEDDYALGSVNAQIQIRHDIEQFAQPGLKEDVRRVVEHEENEEDTSSNDEQDSESSDIEDAESVGEPCSVNKIAGVCKDSRSGGCSGKFVSGKCPGAWYNKCCVGTKSNMSLGKMTNLTCGKNVTCSKSKCSFSGHNRTHLCKIGSTIYHNGKPYSLRWQRSTTRVCDAAKCCKYEGGGEKFCTKWETKKECAPGGTERVCDKFKSTRTCVDKGSKSYCEKWADAQPGKKSCTKICARYGQNGGGSECVKWGYKEECHGGGSGKCLKWGKSIIDRTIKKGREIVKRGGRVIRKHTRKYINRGRSIIRRTKGRVIKRGRGIIRRGRSVVRKHVKRVVRRGRGIIRKHKRRIVSRVKRGRRTIKRRIKRGRKTIKRRVKKTIKRGSKWRRTIKRRVKRGRKTIKRRVKKTIKRKTKTPKRRIKRYTKRRVELRKYKKFPKEPPVKLHSKEFIDKYKEDGAQLRFKWKWKKHAGKYSERKKRALWRARRLNLIKRSKRKPGYKPKHRDFSGVKLFRKPGCRRVRRCQCPSRRRMRRWANIRSIVKGMEKNVEKPSLEELNKVKERADSTEQTARRLLTPENIRKARVNKEFRTMVDNGRKLLARAQQYKKKYYEMKKKYEEGGDRVLRGVERRQPEMRKWVKRGRTGGRRGCKCRWTSQCTKWNKWKKRKVARKGYTTLRRRVVTRRRGQVAQRLNKRVGKIDVQIKELREKIKRKKGYKKYKFERKLKELITTRERYRQQSKGVFKKYEKKGYKCNKCCGAQVGCFKRIAVHVVVKD